MNIEYEATFVKVDKSEMRKKLKAVGATLARPEFLQKRVNFHFPKGHEIIDGWIRVRDEGDKFTMSVKVIDGDKIDDQKEVCLKVNSFTEAITFLENIGCKQKAYQETKRELWLLDKVEVSIDEWPFLEPFIEIEGSSEVAVRAVAGKLAFNWDQAKFCGVTDLYAEKYQISKELINNQTPKIVFDMANPFISF